MQLTRNVIATQFIFSILMENRVENDHKIQLHQSRSDAMECG